MNAWRRMGRLGSLGIAVAALGGLGVVGKRYAEQNLLASVLGPGVTAQSMELHFAKSLACAHDVQIPLANTVDVHEMPVSLQAGKLWFAFDTAALLRKRFVLPKVVMEDVTITANPMMLDIAGTNDSLGNSLVAGPVVSVGFDLPSATDLIADGVVAIDSAIPVSASNDQRVTAASAQSTSQDQDPRGPGLAAPPQTVGPRSSSASVGKPLPWHDSVLSLSRSITDPKTIEGAQVSIDSDMVNEKVQNYFESMRQQSQRFLNEARDIQQSLTSMNNALRHGHQVQESCRRIEQIELNLKQMKGQLNQVDKMLDIEQAALRSALMTEKQSLKQAAENYRAPSALAPAQLLLKHLIAQELDRQSPFVYLMSDLINKPLEYGRTRRGRQLRYLAASNPEFQCETAKLSGQVELDGRAWPFTANGSFATSSGHQGLPAQRAIASASTVSRNVAPDAQSSQPIARGASHDQLSTAASDTAAHRSSWQMSVQRGQGDLELSGQNLSKPHQVKIRLASHSTEKLTLDCQVTQRTLECEGKLALRDLVQQSGQAEKLAGSFAHGFASELELRDLVSRSLTQADIAPELMQFTAPTLDTSKDWTVDPESVDWVRNQLEQHAHDQVVESYTLGTQKLDELIAQKMRQQRSLLATLRRDAEQGLGAQLDELRKLQASVNSFIEQREGNQFARQPSDIVR